MPRYTFDLGGEGWYYLDAEGTKKYDVWQPGIGVQGSGALVLPPQVSVIYRDTPLDLPAAKVCFLAHSAVPQEKASATVWWMKHDQTAACVGPGCFITHFPPRGPGHALSGAGGFDLYHFPSATLLGPRCDQPEVSSIAVEHQDRFVLDNLGVLHQVSSIKGAATPGCTVCAQSTADGTLYCSVAKEDGLFEITSGEVPPSTTKDLLPSSGQFSVFCVECLDKRVVATVEEATPRRLNVTCEPCVGREFVAGRCDFFQGSAACDQLESALPAPPLYRFIYEATVASAADRPRPPLHFDEIPTQLGTPSDSWLGHTVTGLPQEVCAARLTLTLRAGGGGSNNDGLALEFDGSKFLWNQPIRVLTAGGQWRPGATEALTLDLSKLPTSNQPASLLNSLADGQLDVLVQDDTGVDCLRLCVRPGCPPQKAPDLAIEKQPGGDFAFGREGEYSLLVTNVASGPDAGPTTAEIRVVDTLPSYMRPIPRSGRFSIAEWRCTVEGQRIGCLYSEARLSPGTSAPRIVLRFDLIPDRNAPFVANCAQVQTSGDMNSANDRACHSHVVEFRPDLALAKKCRALPGEEVFECTMTVSNGGNAPAASIAVLDTLPDSLVLLPGDHGAGWACTQDPRRRVQCNYGGPALRAGEKAPPLVVRLRGNTSRPKPRNCAQVTGRGDPNPNNDGACDPPATEPTPPQPG